MPGRCTRPATSLRWDRPPGTAAAAAVTTTRITVSRRHAGCMSWPRAGSRRWPPGSTRRCWPGAGRRTSTGSGSAGSAGCWSTWRRSPTTASPRAGGMTWPRSWWWSWWPGCAARTRFTPPRSSRRRCRKKRCAAAGSGTTRGSAGTCRPATRRSSGRSARSTPGPPTRRCAPGCGPKHPPGGWTGGTSPSTARPSAVPSGPTAPSPNLLAAYEVTAGTVLGQADVEAKTNEITCFVPLLHAILDSPRASSDSSPDGDRDGNGEEGEEGEELVIVTADALHTQAGHVEAMNKLRVGWILDLKDNQPGLYALADAHPWGDEPVLHATAGVGHGRHEIRTIRVTSQVPDGITRRFPGTAQMMLIERYRHPVRGSEATAACRAAGDDPRMAGCAAGAKISCETVLALTALTPAQAGPEFLLARNRSHWGIENGLHLRRDTTYAEDASRLRAGSAPRLFSAIASTVVSVLNRAGLTNHAAARRDLGWDRTGLQALDLLGL